MTTKRKKNDVNNTFKQGLGGGILGAFIGAPGLGMVLGVANANKNKIKKFINDFDNNMIINKNNKR